MLNMIELSSRNDHSKVQDAANTVDVQSGPNHRRSSATSTAFPEMTSELEPTSPVNSDHSDEEDDHLPDDLDELDELHAERLRQIDVIVEEFNRLNELANELIELKVNELRRKTRAVLENADSDYRTQLALLEQRRQRRIEIAGLRLSLRLHSIREHERADKLLGLLHLEHAKARARQEVWFNIYTELEKTLSERMLSKLTKLRRVQRRAFHSRRAAADDFEDDILGARVSCDESAHERRQQRTPHCDAYPFIVYTLRPHEIEEDLQAIQQSMLCQPSVSRVELYPESDASLRDGIESDQSGMESDIESLY